MPELRRLTSSWVDNEVHVRCPGGESPHDVISRGVAALHECVFESSNASTILIVAHSRFNKVCISWVYDSFIIYSSDIAVVSNGTWYY